LNVKGACYWVPGKQPKFKENAMTRVGLTCWLLLVPILCSAQQVPVTPSGTPESKPQTKLEAFQASKGTLIVKDFYELGKVAGIGTISIDGVVMTQPGQESNRMRGLRIEVEERGRLERSNISLLDMDEIESLSKALSYMSDLAAKWKGMEKQEYSEVQFATKGDFKIGFYQRKREQGAFVSSGSVGRAQAFIDVQDFAKIKALVDQSLSLLSSK
jgi:hypothetical protein